MALGAVGTVDLRYYAPEFRITINNQELEADISKAILNLKVNERINGVGNFSFVVNDEFDLKTQKFKWLDHVLFELGNSVTIKMGYVGNLQLMIDGKINKLNSSFFSAGAPTLSVEGTDVFYDSLVSQKSSSQRTFDKVKYSDIAQTLASEAGFSAIVDATSERHERIVKRSGTNYLKFLADLAKRVNYEFYVVGRALYFVKPKVEEEEILTLSWGQHLISFQPTTNTTGLVTEVEVRWWNPMTKEEIVGRAGVGEEQTQERDGIKGSEVAQNMYGEAKRVIYRPVSSSEEATYIARAELNRASNQLVVGSGETFGIPELRPGVTIKLENLGTRFSGKYYLTDTTHTIDGNGYKTRFTARRNAI